MHTKPLGLKEQAEAKGKLLLIENSFVRVPQGNIILLEKTKKMNSLLIEKSGSPALESFAVVKRIPVTGFDVNENNRRYAKPLWERVKKNKYAEGTFMLANHPADDDDGSVENIMGVWHNFDLDENHGYGDLWLLEGGKELGRLFYNSLKAGGRNGLSSVGFGEMAENGIDVDPESYELVRLSDWVINPSQRVYATNENIQESAISEKTKIYSVSRYEDTNHIKQESLSFGGENFVEQNLYINNLRNKAKATLREAKKAMKDADIEKMTETKSRINDLMTMLPTDLKEDRLRLEEKFEELEDQLMDKYSEKQKQLDRTSKVATQLVEERKTMSRVLSSLKEKNRKAGDVIRLMQENESVLAGDRKVLSEDRVKMSKDIRRLVEDRQAMLEHLISIAEDKKAMKEDISRFLEDRHNMMDDIKCFLEDRKEMRKDLKVYGQDRKVMESDIKKLVHENKVLKMKLREMGEDGLGNGMEYPVVDEFTPEAPLAEEEIYDYPVDEMGMGMDTMETPSDLIDTPVDQDFGYVAPEDEYTVGDPMESVMPESRRRIRPSIRENVQRRRVPSQPSRMPRMVEQSTSGIRKDVLNFYQEAAKKYPLLARVKGSILASKSLIEAVNKYDAFRSNVESRPLSLKENSKFSVPTDDWLGGRQ